MLMELFGGAGHSKEIAKRLSKDGLLIGMILLLLYGQNLIRIIFLLKNKQEEINLHGCA